MALDYHGHLVFSFRRKFGDPWQNNFLEFPYLWRIAYDMMQECNEVITTLKWERLVEFGGQLMWKNPKGLFSQWYIAPTLRMEDLQLVKRHIEPFSIKRSYTIHYARHYNAKIQTDVSRRLREQRATAVPALGDTKNRWYPVPDIARAWNSRGFKSRSYQVAQANP